MINRSLINTVLIVAVAVSLVACGKQDTAEGKTPRAGETKAPGRPGGGRPQRPGGPGGQPEKFVEAVPVEVAQAHIGPVAAFIAYNSTLEVETAVSIHPETAGLVETLLVEEGDRVKAGDPLLILEHKEQKVQLLESEANLTQAQSRFQRTADLSQRGLVNQQDFDTAAFQVEQARLRVEQARIRVEQATVRAPVDGVITERFVQPGARVTVSTKLFDLMSLDDMIARVHVPGRYLTTVQEGQEAYLTSEFLPGRRFEGWVKRISPVVDPASGTFKVTVGVKPGKEPPPPGLFVNVRIVTDRKERAVLVPKRAVVYEGGDRYLFLVNDGKAEKIRLTAGYEEGDYVEALEDVEPGASVVVLGQNSLKDQAKVRVVNPGPPGTAALSTSGSHAEGATADT